MEIPGVCLCYPAKFLADALLAIGEVVCIAVSTALDEAATLLQDAGEFTGQSEVAAAGDLLQQGNMLFAQGVKLPGTNCDNVACPGHELTQIDPANITAQLGELGKCKDDDDSTPGERRRGVGAYRHA